MNPRTLMVFSTLIVLAASIIAAITDVWNFKVYNLLTFPLVACGIGFNAYYGGQHGCMMSIYGLLVGLGIFIIPYVLGAVGAGDVKYIAGIGAGPLFARFRIPLHFAGSDRSIATCVK